VLVTTITIQRACTVYTVYFSENAVTTTLKTLQSMRSACTQLYYSVTGTYIFAVSLRQLTNACIQYLLKVYIFTYKHCIRRELSTDAVH